MNLVLLLEITENKALVYDPDLKEEFEVSLDTEQVQFYKDMLDENSEEDTLVIYNSADKSLNLISHEKELG